MAFLVALALRGCLYGHPVGGWSLAMTLNPFAFGYGMQRRGARCRLAVPATHRRRHLHRGMHGEPSRGEPSGATGIGVRDLRAVLDEAIDRLQGLKPAGGDRS